MKMFIENDGPRYRWVLLEGDRRVAKAARWWDAPDDAAADYAEFCDGMVDATVVVDDDEGNPTVRRKP